MHKNVLLFLMLPVLFALPVQAQDLDIQTDTVRIRMDQTGGLQIDSAQGGSIVLPGMSTLSNRFPVWQPSHSSINSLPNSTIGSPNGLPNGLPNPSTVRLPSNSAPTVRSSSTSTGRCTNDTQESSQTSRSSGGVSQTYSSSTTSTCH